MSGLFVRTEGQALSRVILGQIGPVRADQALHLEGGEFLHRQLVLFQKLLKLFLQVQILLLLLLFVDLHLPVKFPLLAPQLDLQLLRLLPRRVELFLDCVDVVVATERFAQEHEIGLLFPDVPGLVQGRGLLHRLNDILQLSDFGVEILTFLLELTHAGLENRAFDLLEGVLVLLEIAQHFFLVRQFVVDLAQLQF